MDNVEKDEYNRMVKGIEELDIFNVRNALIKMLENEIGVNKYKEKEEYDFPPPDFITGKEGSKYELFNLNKEMNKYVDNLIDNLRKLDDTIYDIIKKHNEKIKTSSLIIDLGNIYFTLFNKSSFHN